MLISKHLPLCYIQQKKYEFKNREEQLMNLLVEFTQKDDPFCQHILHYQDQIYQKAEKLSKLEHKMNKLTA